MRRDFLKLCGFAGLGFAVPFVHPKLASAAPKDEPYAGPYYVVFNASGGFDSAGVLAQVTYKFGNGITAGAFGSYNRLLGDAASSPLTDDKNQWTAGLSLSYTFNIGKAWW